MIVSTKKDPFRTKDWRWLRVQDLLDTKRTPDPAVDDEHVVRAYKFLVRLRAADTPMAANKEGKIRKLINDFSDLYYA